MALRKHPLITGEIYHVFNRSVQGIPILKGHRECNIFLKAVKYYLQVKPPVKFSVYRTSPNGFPLDFKNKVVTIFNYCLMPNHFHFILRQEHENGIRQFIQRISNSFAHYFAIKYKNRGPLFEGNFKAVRLENDEQLIHLSRYIHLNPVTAFLCENPKDFFYSSYNIFLEQGLSDLIDPRPILSLFPSPKKYQEFVLAQKDYQRELEKIKHLILE